MRTVDFQTQSSSASDHELGSALLHPLLRPDEECEYCSRVDHHLPSFLYTLLLLSLSRGTFIETLPAACSLP